MTDLPPQAITAAGNALRARWLNERPGIPDPMDWAQTALEAAAPHLAAAEREACADLAIDLKFTLWRPGPEGPGSGQRALDVVPLTELLHQLRKGHR